MIKWAYIIFVGCCILSCGKDDNTTPMNFYDTYFPLSSGIYVDYHVREIIHDELASNPHDTSTYYLRTQISDTVIDNQGRLAYKFLRLIRMDTTDIWEISDVWTTIRNNNKPHNS